MSANRAVSHSRAALAAALAIHATLPVGAHEHPERHSHLATSNQPRILYVGEGGAVCTQSEAMAAALRAARIAAPAIKLPSKDHFTANEHIGRPGDASTIVVERFLESLDLL